MSSITHIPGELACKVSAKETLTSDLVPKGRIADEYELVLTKNHSLQQPSRLRSPRWHIIRLPPRLPWMKLCYTCSKDPTP